MVVVRIVSFSEVRRRRPHVRGFRGGGREQRRPLETYGQRKGRRGAETGGSAVLVDRPVPHRPRQPAIKISPLVRLDCSRIPLTPAQQQPDEGRPKRLVEDGVDDGVDRRADVAQPQANHFDVLRNLAVRTGGEDDVEDEERRPAEDEREEHQPQDFGGLLLGGDAVGRQRLALHSPRQQSATEQLGLINGNKRRLLLHLPARVNLISRRCCTGSL